MGKGQRIRDQRQANQQVKTPMAQFTPDELNQLESIKCPECGDTFQIPGLELRSIPMTHPKSGGQQGTAFMNVSTCLTCKIQKAITKAMMSLAKKPYEEI